MVGLAIVTGNLVNTLEYGWLCLARLLPPWAGTSTSVFSVE
ncbi:hypothetical protein [Streptomyces antimycoticus]